MEALHEYGDFMELTKKNNNKFSTTFSLAVRHFVAECLVLIILLCEKDFELKLHNLVVLIA